MQLCGEILKAIKGFRNPSSFRGTEFQPHFYYASTSVLICQFNYTLSNFSEKCLPERYLALPEASLERHSLLQHNVKRIWY